MDTKIYQLIFNNEYIYYVHEYYLNKFNYFRLIFADNILLENNIINININFHYDNLNKKFNKKIIDYALYLAYNIDFVDKLYSHDCYDLIMLMDYLQFDDINKVDNYIYKLYSNLDKFNLDIFNFYDNNIVNRIKKKLLEINIENNFYKQLFNFSNILLNVFITLGDNNKYYINYIKLDKCYNNENYTNNNIGDWFRTIFTGFLKIYNINIIKFYFNIDINDDKFIFDNINLNDNYLLITLVNIIKFDDKTLIYKFKFDLNNFIKNIIIEHYFNNNV